MKFIKHIILILSLSIAAVPALAELPSIDVYKSPYCGCCKAWITHLEESGFEVISHDRDNMSEIKAKLGISNSLASCHTGIVDGYFIEGHVPASDIKRMLSEKSNIKGLTVPKMPSGVNVPGMETHSGKAKYDVLSVSESGTRIYSHYE